MDPDVPIHQVADLGEHWYFLQQFGLGETIACEAADPQIPAEAVSFGPQMTGRGGKVRDEVFPIGGPDCAYFGDHLGRIHCGGQGGVDFHEK
jgi:hypothetical protein